MYGQAGIFKIFGGTIFDLIEWMPWRGARWRRRTFLIPLLRGRNYNSKSKSPPMQGDIEGPLYRTLPFNQIHFSSLYSIICRIRMVFMASAFFCLQVIGGIFVFGDGGTFVNVRWWMVTCGWECSHSQMHGASHQLRATPSILLKLFFTSSLLYMFKQRFFTLLIYNKYEIADIF